MQSIEEIIPLSISVEDMPLNETDKAWVHQEIQSAHRRRGWGKLSGFLKDWGGLGIVAVIGIFILSEWGNYIEFRTRAGDKLGGIEKNIQTIEIEIHQLIAKIEAIRLRQLASDPVGPQNESEISKLLENAKANKIDIDEAAIREVGSKFISAAEKNPSARNTAREVLNYRSFLNAKIAPKITNVGPPSYSVSYPFMVREGFKGKLKVGVLASRDAVPMDQAAKIEPTDGRHFEKAPGNVGPAWFILSADVPNVVHIGLDNMLYKNVIIENVVISYQGGPVILDHVIFVNCIFEITNKQPGKNLASSVLAFTPTSFTVPRG